MQVGLRQKAGLCLPLRIQIRRCRLFRRSMCEEGAEECECNSWVYCGDPATCGEQHQQCWLKKQADVLAPQVHASSDQCPWTSGIINSPGQVRCAMRRCRGGSSNASHVGRVWWHWRRVRV